MSNKPPILQGIRVLDLSRILVGPYCSQNLSDLGAEVLKVETFEGDDTRKWGPPYNNESSTYYLSLGRNKKSIAINLKSPEGLQTIYDLARISDVFLENFSSSVPKSLKVDYDSIKLQNPRIIYGSVTGYGNIGPLATSPGFDAVIQSFSGLMSITGKPDGDPSRVGVPITDVLAGQVLTNGILAGLYHREKTGEGIKVNTSLLESALAALVNVGSAYLNAGVTSKRVGNHHPSIVPYGTYCVKDGKFITIAVGNEKQYESLMKILGLELKKEFSSNKDRVMGRVKFAAYLNEALEKWELNDLKKRLDAEKIPCQPVNDVPSAMEHEQTKALKIIKTPKEVKHHKDLRFVGSPLRFDGVKDVEVKEPPLVNEHAMYILKDLLKYDEAKIQDLIRKKAILEPKIGATAKL